MKHFTFKDFIYLCIIIILIYLFVGQRWELESKYNKNYKELYEAAYYEKKLELGKILLGYYRESH